jgi:hypothetical protein
VGIPSLFGLNLFNFQTASFVSVAATVLLVAACDSKSIIQKTEVPQQGQREGAPTFASQTGAAPALPTVARSGFEGSWDPMKAYQVAEGYLDTVLWASKDVGCFANCDVQHLVGASFEVPGKAPGPAKEQLVLYVTSTPTNDCPDCKPQLSALKFEQSQGQWRVTRFFPAFAAWGSAGRLHGVAEVAPKLESATAEQAVIVLELVTKPDGQEKKQSASYQVDDKAVTLIKRD